MSIESVYYRGCRIVIEDDVQDVEGDLSFDCRPVVAYSSDGLQAYGKIEVSVPPLEPADAVCILRNGLLPVLTEYKSLRVLREDYARGGFETITDALYAAISDFFNQSRNSEKLELLQKFYSSVKGWPAVISFQHGCTQSDWSDVLVVSTPDYAVGSNSPETSVSALQSCYDDAELWGNWRFGRVYRFMVCDSDGNELAASGDFYGSDHEKSGLLESAKSEVDLCIKERRVKRLQRLKALIVNRVPLNRRFELVEGI